MARPRRLTLYSSAGYALFKAKDKKLLKGGDSDLNSVDGTVGALKLKKFTVCTSSYSFIAQLLKTPRNLKMP